MIRIIARFWAKKKYVWREELDAATKDLNASAAQYRAGERRQAIAKLNAEADAIDANIKRVDELQEKGYWMCEDGHEKVACDLSLCREHEAMMCEECKTVAAGDVLVCEQCKKPMKLIRRDLMTGQEKYESEKERREAQQMADANRKAAADHEEQIKGHEDTAAMFRKQAKQSREFAELLRKL